MTAGTGYYQEKGHQIRLFRKGDVITVAPDVVHWHGATPDSGFTHIAVTTKAQKGETVWLHPVTDEEYKSFKSTPTLKTQ